MTAFKNKMSDSNYFFNGVKNQIMYFIYYYTSPLIPKLKFKFCTNIHIASLNYAVYWVHL